MSKKFFTWFKFFYRGVIDWINNLKFKNMENGWRKSLLLQAHKMLFLVK